MLIKVNQTLELDAIAKVGEAFEVEVLGADADSDLDEVLATRLSDAS